MLDNTDFTASDLDFEAQDEQDAANADALRSILFDLPVRPGTRR